MTHTPGKDALTWQQCKTRTETIVELRKPKKKAVKKTIFIGPQDLMKRVTHISKLIQSREAKYQKNIKKTHHPLETEDWDDFCLLCPIQTVFQEKNEYSALVADNCPKSHAFLVSVQSMFAWSMSKLST